MSSKSKTASADFGYLKRYDLSDLPERKFTFYDIEGEPTLTVVPATSANKGYWSGVMERSAKRKRSESQLRRLAAGKVGADFIAEQQANAKALLPEHCIKGWEGVLNSQGKDVPFSTENAALFIEALPDWIYGILYTFITNPRSFVGDAEPDEDDIAGLAKN